MALITTLSTTERNDIEVSLNQRTMRNGNVSYQVDVWLKIEDFEYTEFRSKELSEVQKRYAEAVQAVKAGWHP